jgi:glutathionylspermidine amidase/synthetase
MKSTSRPKPARFGTLLGVAPGGVPVYSSDYDTASRREYPNRQSYRSYLDGIFMGYKWQCVELARRWMYVNKGYIFDDIAMAYDIFELTSVRVIKDNSTLPLHSFRNGSQRHPEPGCLLIWEEGGEFHMTGHVAVVTEVSADYIRFVEQNVGHAVWPEGRHYSRELRTQVTEDGGYWVQCSFQDAKILGWVIQTDDDTHAERRREVDRRLYNLALGRVEEHGQHQSSWLNVANPDEAAYVAMMKGHRLGSRPEDQYKYLRLSNSAEKALKRATNELHAMFMHATNHVLQDDELLARFNLPRAIWPKIHQSWDNRRNQMITGRFDFAISEDGIKVYEYNADSASCYMETGKVQNQWAEHFGCDEGDCAGGDMVEDLIEAWKGSGVNDVLHIMQDTDLEETYHALFIREIIEAAGIRTKVIRGVKGLSWTEDGRIRDADGVLIKWVWKTWAWETALDQIRAECEDDEEKLRTYKTGVKRAEAPRLVDVLLRKEVMVYEPLWTLIPSNKAILPILWQLFPNHPYLLNAQFTLTDELRDKGYAVKPIAGRCGFNISIFDTDNTLMEETVGGFDQQDQIYQELCKLPRIDDYSVQVCTFTAAGVYAGACVRVDPTLVITKDSDLLALRIVDDRDMPLDA